MVPECLHSGSLLQHLSEIMTTADAADSTVVEDILSKTNHFLSIEACNFIADKGYDVKAVYNLIKGVYHGECVIPLNKHNTKNPEKLPSGHPICEAGLAMHKTAEPEFCRKIINN